jgi:type IV pilus assembly protein PilE
VKRRNAGFTLLEMMVVVALVAILAGVALPSYSAYLQRSRIVDAVMRLSDTRARMEDYFQDERSYVDAAGRCGALPDPAATDSFTVRCEGTTTTYSITATGIAAKGMASFTYAIDQAGAKATVSLPSGWVRAAACWTIRQDGFCV